MWCVYSPVGISLFCTADVFLNQADVKYCEVLPLHKLNELQTSSSVTPIHFQVFIIHYYLPQSRGQIQFPLSLSENIRLGSFWLLKAYPFLPEGNLSVPFCPMHCSNWILQKDTQHLSELKTCHIQVVVYCNFC